MSFIFLYKLTQAEIQASNSKVWWYGGASVPTAWVICIYVKVPLMQRHMLEFWRDIYCRKDDDYSQEFHVYFSRTMPGLILHKLQQCGFVGIECVCLTVLPAVQICLLLKMYGVSWWGESDNGDHRLLSSSSLQLILLAKLQQLISSVPKWLHSVIKSKGGYPVVNMPLSQLFLSALQASISKFIFNK